MTYRRGRLRPADETIIGKVILAKLVRSDYNHDSTFHLIMFISIKRIIGCLWILSLLGFLSYSACYAKPIKWLVTTDITSTLTQDSTKIIDTSSIKDNPITAWSNAAVGKSSLKGKIEWLISIPTTNYNTILGWVLAKIQNFVNRSLGLLALLCVIYLVYNGVMLLIKFDDEKSQSEALNSIKTVAWVIWWIWLTWFIISAAFYIVSKFA